MPSFSGREKESKRGGGRRKGKGTEDKVHMFILGDQIILLLHLTGGKYEAQDVQMGYQMSNIKYQSHTDPKRTVPKRNLQKSVLL